jgi:hypothetical protein
MKLPCIVLEFDADNRLTTGFPDIPQTHLAKKLCWQNNMELRQQQ